MRGSNALIEKLMRRRWDDDFVVVEPGETVTYAAFRTTATTAANLNFHQTGPST
jgi:hypothetical protein